MNDDLTEAVAANQRDLPIVPPRGFELGEFEYRAQRVQALMCENGIDVLWLTTEADVRYLSGFLTQFWQSPTRPWHLLLPASGFITGGIHASDERWKSKNRSFRTR